MKSLLLLPLILFTSLPVQAYGTSGARCYEEVWREEYVPGSYNRRGYVRRWQETVEVPCRRRQPSYQEPAPHRGNEDNNSCIEGSIIGGLLGAAGGAALSRGEGNFIGIPLGIAGGALIGCQVDGG
jgi:hypothetical protein